MTAIEADTQTEAQQKAASRRRLAKGERLRTTSLTPAEATS